MGLGAEREVRYQNETTFATLPAAWSSGTPFLAIDPNSEGLKQDTVENANYRQRALATRAKVLALANGTCSFKCYAHGRSTAVTSGSRATITSPNFHLAHFLQNAWGGIRLGYRTTIASGTAAAPVVAAAAGANYAAGDWVFFIDISVDTTRGYFRKIASISTDTFTMWAGHDLPATPAASDIMGAVIQAYPHVDVIKNPAHASHLTQSFLFMGDDSDDAQQGVGVKLNLTAEEGYGAGEMPTMTFEGMSTELTNEAITQPSAGTPIGDAPLVTSTGDDTIVSFSAVGATLATITPQSITITPGIASQPIPAVGGVQGRSGYTLAQSSADEVMVEMVVAYDDAYASAFAAGTRYQLLVQVGTQPGRAIGRFFANLEIAEDPARTVSTDLTTTTLKLRALESDVATAATGDNLEKVRAKTEWLFSCATS